MQIVTFAPQYWEVLLLLAIGVTLALQVAKKPRLFWPLLIIVNLVGLGPSLMKYFFWDKALTAFILLGALRRKKDPTQAKIGVKPSDHSMLFNLWIAYMVAESIIGVVANADVRIIFWVLFYGTLGLLSYILYHRGGEFPFPSLRQFSITVLVTVLVYNIALLAYGAIVEQVLGLEAGRFAAQFVYRDTFVWAPPSVSSYPSIVGMPVAVLALTDRSVRLRLLALASVSAMVLAAFYYDSRAAYIAIAVSIVLSLGKARLSGLAALAAILIPLFNYSMGGITTIQDFLSTEVLESGQMLWAPSERDMPRQRHTVAGFIRVTDNLRTFFIGDGFYLHRTTIIPAMQKANEGMPAEIVAIASQELRDDDFFRTNAFTALLIDTGVIGMLMLIALFLRCAFRVVALARSNRALLVSMLILAFAWQFSVNTTGLCLFYLMFMPLGLIEQLSRLNSRNAPPMIVRGNAPVISRRRLA